MWQWVTAQRINFITLGIIGGALLGGYSMHIRGNADADWGLLISLSMGLSAFATLFNFWRMQRIAEAPISTIAAAAQGYIELQGKASTAKPFKTPFHGIPCVWYRAWVYANRLAEDNKRDTRLLEYVESNEIFQLTDDTGTCLVNPEGAEVVHSEQRTQYKNDHRYVEEYLPTGHQLYLLGYLDTRHNYLSEEAIVRDTGQLLAKWKSEPIKLRNRFDHDRNGQIDMQEWELARAEARQEVERHHLMRAGNDLYTISQPQANKLFLISVLSPETLRYRYQYWSMVHFFILLLLLMVYLRVA